MKKEEVNMKPLSKEEIDTQKNNWLSSELKSIPKWFYKSLWLRMRIKNKYESRI